MQLTSTHVINKSISVAAALLFSLSLGSDSWLDPNTELWPFFNERVCVCVCFCILTIAVDRKQKNSIYMNIAHCNNCIGCNQVKWGGRKMQQTASLLLGRSVINCTFKQWMMRLMTLTFETTSTLASSLCLAYSCVLLTPSLNDNTQSRHVCIWYSFVTHTKVATFATLALNDAHTHSNYTGLRPCWAVLCWTFGSCCCFSTYILVRHSCFS